MSKESLCPNYVGVTCVNGSCPIALYADFPEYFDSKPNSCNEQIIPLDSTPLIVDFFIVPPGSTAPGNATITCWPFSTFGAPHTICKS